MKRVFSIIGLILWISLGAYAQTAVTRSEEKVVIDGKKYYLHTVEQGQTLFSICKAYEVSVDDVNEENLGLNSNIVPNQVIKIPILVEISNDGKNIVYIVKRGDTLYSLCRKYDVTEDEFYELNSKLRKNKKLKAGQEILFPNNKAEGQQDNIDRDTVKFYYHHVVKGETFYGLMRTYELSRDEIVEANPGIDEEALRVDQIIKIPRKTEFVYPDESLVNDSVLLTIHPIDSIIAQSKNVCDSLTWFNHGKEFEIFVLLPFEVSANLRNMYNQEVGSRDQRLYLLTEKIVSFYSGMLVALDNFKSADVKINLRVFDIGKDNIILTDLLKNNKLANADLIIGPAFSSQIEYLNSNINDTSVSIVLPFVNDDDLLRRYSNNIILKTSNDLIYKDVAKYASEYPQYRYFVIQGTTAEQIKEATKFTNALKTESDSTLNVSIIKFNGKSLASLKSVISKETENVFILPFSSEAASTKIFTELFPLKDYEITLLGSRLIMDYESIDANYYEKSKFSYFSCIDVNYSDSLTNIFINKYHDAFLCEPDDFSFIAYDGINFILQELIRSGRGFGQCISCNHDFNGLFGNMNFVHQPYYARRSYSNSTVYIYTLQEDFTFKKVYPDLDIVPENDE
jgi:LysM repeat protein